GHFTRDRFAVLPEIGFKFGYDINEHLRVWAGYSALWLTEAVRRRADRPRHQSLAAPQQHNRHRPARRHAAPARAVQHPDLLGRRIYIRIGVSLLIWSAARNRRFQFFFACPSRACRSWRLRRQLRAKE